MQMEVVTDHGCRQQPLGVALVHRRVVFEKLVPGLHINVEFYEQHTTPISSWYWERNVLLTLYVELVSAVDAGELNAQQIFVSANAC